MNAILIIFNLLLLWFAILYQGKYYALKQELEIRCKYCKLKHFIEKEKDDEGV